MPSAASRRRACANQSVAIRVSASSATAPSPARATSRAACASALASSEVELAGHPAIRREYEHVQAGTPVWVVSYVLVVAREAFVVTDGFDCLMTADYSQIEMRIMAHLSGDEGLIDAFRAGEDLHRFVGSRVFGVPAAEVTPAMRSKVKAMSYGLAYGLSAYGLSRQLAVDVAEARTLMDGYFERFGGVRDYLTSVVERARRTGYTETIMGRRRYLPDLNSDNRQRRELAERTALNAPIQGSAADIIKVAMVRLDERLAAEGLATRVLLQVHDELVLEVAPGERDAATAAVRDAMAGAADLAVPLDVSVGTGRTWREAAH